MRTTVGSVTEVEGKSFLHVSISDVNADQINPRVHVQTNKLLGSLSGRATIAGATIAVLSDTEINVAIEIKDGSEDRVAGKNGEYTEFVRAYFTTKALTKD